MEQESLEQLGNMHLGRPLSSGLPQSHTGSSTILPDSTDGK